MVRIDPNIDPANAYEGPYAKGQASKGWWKRIFHSSKKKRIRETDNAEATTEEKGRLKEGEGEGQGTWKCQETEDS